MILYSEFFFYAALFFYGAANYYFVRWVCKADTAFFGYFRQWMAVAVLAGVFGLITRFRESGHLPFVTLFEITYLYAWMTGLLLLIFVRAETPRLVQGVVLAMIDAILIWNICMDRNIYPLNPMLESYWLAIHVPAAIVGYSAFAISFGASIYYLWAARKKSALDAVVRFIGHLTLGGCGLLGICIVTGAVWAKSAWGQYWSWDPKETWALVTFLIYGIAVVIQQIFKLNPRWQAILSVSGFTAMLMTFFGVAFFFHSHHTYR